MAKEIVIYEQTPRNGLEPEKVRCIFVFKTKFERGGSKFPFTPSINLPTPLAHLFQDSLKDKFNDGSRSWLDSGVIQIPVHFTQEQRDEHIKKNYHAQVERFRSEVERPKARDVEYINVAGGDSDG